MILVIKKNKVFNIGDYKVSNIVIYSKILWEKVVSSKVMKKYDKLIKYLTELLVSDDDTGDVMREALNQIVKIQKASNERLIEIHNSYLELLNNKISK